MKTETTIEKLRQELIFARDNYATYLAARIPLGAGQGYLCPYIKGLTDGNFTETGRQYILGKINAHLTVNGESYDTLFMAILARKDPELMCRPHSVWRVQERHNIFMNFLRQKFLDSLVENLTEDSVAGLTS